MTQYRPPLGGLFRLQAPRPEARADEPSAAQTEARDAIRHFVRVLERLDREANRPVARTGTPRSKREKAR
ncbi:MAG: hypothetical protein ACRCUE_03565 [Bosea sp. (in: a-proteobacteria)]